MFLCTYSWNFFSGRLLSLLKSYLLRFPVPLWLGEKCARTLPGAPLALPSRWISAWALILCLLVPSLVPCTSLFPGVWWACASLVRTQMFCHPQLHLPELVPLVTSRVFPCSVEPPCFFPVLIRCYKGQFSKVHASHKSQASTTHLSFSLFLLHWKFSFSLW